MDTSQIDHIVRGFHDKTLPQEEWTHQAHLTVGLHAVLTHGREASIPIMREGIKSYNLSGGVQNTDTGGYHESITIFFLHALEAFVAQQGESADLPELVRLLLESEMMERPFILQFYRKETIFSVHARHHWVEPDVRPLTSLVTQMA